MANSNSKDGWIWLALGAAAIYALSKYSAPVATEGDAAATTTAQSVVYTGRDFESGKPVEYVPHSKPGYDYGSPGEGTSGGLLTKDITRTAQTPFFGPPVYYDDGELGPPVFYDSPMTDEGLIS